MHTLLLSAGYGKRLKPLTNNLPKCLMKFGSNVILDFWVNYAKKMNSKKIFINTHYLYKQVELHKKNNYDSSVESFYEPTLLGTAGTLAKIINLYDLDSILVAHADNFSIFDINLFIEAFNNRPKSCNVTVMTFITSRPSSCGILELNEDGVVVNLYEKVKNPPSNFASGAVYIFDKTAIDEINKMSSVEDIPTDILPHFMGRINTYHNDLFHKDIGCIQDYNEALKFYENNKKLYKQFLS